MRAKTQVIIQSANEADLSRTDDELPLVTINILSFNRQEELRITLGKVTRELAYPAEKKEIIVVDNASTDGSVEMVRREFPSVKVLLKDRNVGISGWNAGFEAGQGEYFLVLDDDCYLEGDALQTLVRMAVKDKADIVSFEILNPMEPGFSHHRLFNGGMLSFWGCAVLLSRPVVQSLRGFDPGIFIYAHEAEFVMRALNGGFRHLFVPRIYGQHQKKPGWYNQSTAKSVFMNYRNTVYTAARLLRGMACWKVCLRIWLGAAMMFRHDRARALTMFKGWLYGILAGLQSRQPVDAALSGFYADQFFLFMNPLRFRGIHHRAKLEAFWKEAADVYDLDQARVCFLQKATPE